METPALGETTLVSYECFYNHLPHPRSHSFYACPSHCQSFLANCQFSTQSPVCVCACVTLNQTMPFLHVWTLHLSIDTAFSWPSVPVGARPLLSFTSLLILHLPPAILDFLVSERARLTLPP